MRISTKRAWLLVGVVLSASCGAAVALLYKGAPATRIGLAVVAGLAVALVLWLIARLARQARQKRERFAFLEVKLQCKGGCKDSWQPRKGFFEIQVLDKGKSDTPPYVCANCYQRITGESPDGNPKARHAF
jgi:hypothetical protein